MNNEYVACILCSSTSCSPMERETSLLRLPDPFKVVRCRRCGLMYMNPRPIRGESYKKCYYEAMNILQYEEGRSGRFYTDKYRRLERLLPLQGTLLDLGCGTGHFLNVGRLRGWRVFGMDISDWALTYGKGSFGLKVIKSEAQAAPFRPDSFDVIILHHVLEHLPQPGEVLKSLRGLLRKNGILLIEVPNEFRDLLFLVSGRWGRRRYYPRPGPVLHHFYFFTPHTLTRLLDGHGFIVLSMTTMNRTLFLHSSLPLGRAVKKVVYTLGGFCGRGPFIEVFARIKSEI